MQVGRRTERQRVRKADSQTDGQTGRHAVRLAGRKADR